MSKIQKSRLGRGLSSLIGTSAELPVEVELPSPATADVSDTVPGVQTIPVNDIHPNPHQPRRVWDEARLAELAASIRSTGLIQPVVVRKAETGYQLIAGERRLRAAKLAGLADIPAILREANSYEQAQMALVENIQREDLNAIDRAESYKSLMDQLGLTQGELAVRLGEDRSMIAHHIRLLELPDDVRQLLRDRKLSLGHAKLLAGLDRAQQSRMAGMVVESDLSVRRLEEIITGAAQPNAPADAPAKPSIAPHLKQLETSISRQLGLRAQVRATGTGKKGRLIIHYRSLDEFDALLARLGVEVD